MRITEVRSILGDFTFENEKYRCEGLWFEAENEARYDNNLGNFKHYELSRLCIRKVSRPSGLLLSQNLIRASLEFDTPIFCMANKAYKLRGTKCAYFRNTLLFFHYTVIRAYIDARN